MSEPRRKLSFRDRGVAQVALVVENLERMVEQYWNRFGIGPWHFYFRTPSRTAGRCEQCGNGRAISTKRTYS